MYKGIIFDFNGTFFWDSEFHDEAWIKFGKKYNKYLTLNDIDKNIHGRTNQQILKWFFNKDIDKKLEHQYIYEKESIYKEICLSHPEKLHLADGAEKFLNFLNYNNIPKTIATAADESNVDFYFEIFKLEKWFKKDLIIFNDGNIKGKPAPDVFQAAALKLNLSPEECIVVEDSLSGLQAAKNAKIGYIIAIKNNRTKLSLNDTDFHNKAISSFDQIDKLIFN